MTKNYSNSKIYEIICRITNERYIGSTVQPLSKRLAEHRNPSNMCSSKQIIVRGNYYINLIEDFPVCQNREQLLKKEREWYDKLECINKARPTISKEEKVEYYKQYREENALEITEYKKQYYQDNAIEIAEKSKQYRTEHAVEIAERAKQYSKEHVEQIKQYKSENALQIAARRKQYNTEHAEEIRAYKQANKERANLKARERVARNKLAKLNQVQLEASL